MAEIPQMLSRPFPRFPLYGGGLLVLFSLLLAGGMRLSGIDIAQPTVGKPVIVRDLHFADRSDGGIVVSDAAAGDRVVEIVKPETGYFLRATLRGLAQQRKREELGQSAPFRLSGWPDGRLTLDDTATGRRVDLEAFGETNEEVFAKLLMTPPTMATAAATVQTAAP